MSLEKKNDLHWNMPGISQGGGDPRMSLGCEWRRRRNQFISFPLFPSLELILISILILFFFFFNHIYFVGLYTRIKQVQVQVQEEEERKKKKKKKKRKEKDEVITACGRPRSREHPRGWPSSQRKGLGAEGQPRARRPAKLQKKKKRV